MFVPDVREKQRQLYLHLQVPAVKHSKSGPYSTNKNVMGNTNEGFTQDQIQLKSMPDEDDNAASLLLFMRQHTGGCLCTESSNEACLSISHVSHACVPCSVLCMWNIHSYHG
jgi:hypothetical protein